MLQAAELHRIYQGRFGREFYNFARLDSTNEAAARFARNACPDGTVVLANEQTSGRGRKGNTWYSPADVNLYFSVILYPALPHLPYLPFCAGLAVVGGLKKIELNAELKWPNDVLVNGKKICGLLLETSIEQNSVRYAIVGCGINVNGNELPPEIKDTATTVSIEKGSSVSRESLLAAILLEFEILYGRIGDMTWDQFCIQIEKHSSFIRGCSVRIQQGPEIFEGTTSGLDSYGGLILDTQGERKAFYSGEVQLCRKK